MVASVIRGRWFDPLKRTFELKITSSELKTLNSFEIQSEVIPDFFFKYFVASIEYRTTGLEYPMKCSCYSSLTQLFHWSCIH